MSMSNTTKRVKEIRWPGVIKPGTIINDIFHHMDWLPTFLAAAGEPGIKCKLLKGHKTAGKEFNVHLDGYDQTALLKGEGPGARQEIHYISDDGDYGAFRYGKWKVTFLTQDCVGMGVWDCVYTAHRQPRLADLRADPFERAQQYGATNYWGDWAFRRAYVCVPVQTMVGKLISSFSEYPPRSKPASFSVGNALKGLETAAAGSH